MIDVLLPTVAIMLGCCSNVITLESMMKRDTGSGDLITFAQFVFVALEGLYFHVESSSSPSSSSSSSSLSSSSSSSSSTSSAHTRKRVTHVKKSSWFPLRIKARKIPLPYYMIMVLIFFLVSVLNNKALGYNISLPFHMIFRSGSLLANMLLGAAILKKRYSMSQFASVLLLTVGVFLATTASASQVKQAKATELEPAIDYTMWMIGVSMLLAALLLSSTLGLYQEWLYSFYGKENYRESMFYSHILAIPFFGLFYKEITTHIGIYSASAPYTLPYLNVTLPILWWYLIINVITQYICIRGVFTLGGKTGSSLTSTLVISVRKFVSLVISVVYFGNPFSALHWFSTALVFAGTILYTFAPKPDSIKPKADAKKE